jgi:hypothetical protein
MSSFWIYKSENNNNLIKEIYCNSITKTYFGKKKYKFHIVFNNDDVYDLDKIDKIALFPHLSLTEKKILQDAFNNLNQLKINEMNFFEKMINEIKTEIKK